MAAIPTFHGVVTKAGTLELLDVERIRRRVYLLGIAGKEVEIVIKVHRDRRSTKQNAWWWGIAVPLIAHELGYDRHEHDRLHYALVSLCFGTTVDAVTKQEIPNVRSSQLMTVQFADLMEWAVRWAAQEHGIVIPLPNESEAA